MLRDTDPELSREVLDEAADDFDKLSIAPLAQRARELQSIG
jgi:hypothetical protein